MEEIVENVVYWWQMVIMEASGSSGAWNKQLFQVPAIGTKYGKWWQVVAIVASGSSKW